MANGRNVVVWIIVIVAAVLIAQNMGWFTIGSTNNAGVQTTGVVPSTGLTAITLNTKDALAPTDVNANVSYYLFTSDGSFFNSGTTAAGKATVNVNYGQTYDLIAYADTTYYPVSVSFSADSGQGASKTINMALDAVSNATVNKIRNPVDLSSNLSVGLGQQVAFDLLYSVTSSSSAINAPVIVVDVNQTSVQDVSIGSLSKVTCPTRLTTGAGRKKICFQDTTLLSTSGIRTLSGNILFSSSATPSKTDTMSVIIIDTQEYSDSNYVTKGKSAFHVGTENPNTNADVGASDSAAASIQFGG